MLIDISSLLSGEKTEIKFDFTLPGEGLGDLGFGVEVSELTVVGCVKSIGGCMFFNASVSVPYKAPCDRCLKTVHGVLCAELERTVGGDDEDSLKLVNSHIDADEELYEEAILCFPQKLVCSDSCRGLCPNCGKDLNEGDCSCKKQVDPRLAPLMSLLSDDDKE